MPRPDKVAAVEEVKSDLEASVATLVTNYRGLTVAELHALRAELRKNNASYRVAKNTLTRLAASQAGIEGFDTFLTGPTALVFCREDPVGPAKALKAFAKDHPELEVKGGYLDGEILDEAAAVKLADLESREELLAKLAGLMYGALANTARLLKAPIEQQARLMQALADAGGAEAKGFDVAAPADTPGPVDTPEAPAAEEPAAETPAEEPVAETPAEEPVAETPAEEPVAEEAPADEPVAEEPAAEASADEPAAETESDAADAAEAPAEDED